MNTKEIIEKLKDPDRVVPYCCLSTEEGAIIDKAGQKNCLRLTDDGDFIDMSSLLAAPARWPGKCYLLKPDYEPEPEYEDTELCVGEYCKDIRNGGGRLIQHMVCDPAFVGFFHEGGHRVVLDYVATAIHEGHKVVARFRKEQGNG